MFKSCNSNFNTSSDCFAQGQVLSCKQKNLGCSSAKDRSSTANSGNSFIGDWICAVASHCFPHLHSLFSIWTDLKSSEKIPGALTWRWGEWIWLTGPSGLSPQGLNISSIKIFDQIRDLEIPITLHPLIHHSLIIIIIIIIMIIMMMINNGGGNDNGSSWNQRMVVAIKKDT